MARGIAVIDAETDPFKKGRITIKPFVWGYYNGSEYHQFTTTADLVEFIQDRDEIIYAHNGGKFDFHLGLLEYIEPYGELMIINGRISKMSIGACELRDSWNIIPVKLADYKKDEVDYAIFEETERHKWHNWETITKYLKSDCVYLFELIDRFVAEYGMHLTQAGASMKQWEKISPLPVPRTDADFYNQFAPYYYGGRVECFERGILDVDFDVVDINSAYPDAMLRQHPYSPNFSTYRGYKPNADFYRLRCVSRGAFPFRGHGGTLSFPTDGERREYTITGWELQAAIDTKSISEVEYIESIIFCSHVDFSEYILKNYNLRLAATEAGDLAGRLLYKLAMNSLYGKFAANPENYKEYMVVPMEEAAGIAGIGWQFGGELGPWALAEAPISEERQRYYNVATGASITGFVRAKLWRAIHGSGRVLYCDTDSLAVVGPGDDIIIGDKLGQWKNEGAFDRAGIAGKKLYIFRGVFDKEKGERNYKTAAKGVRLTNSQLWRVASGKEVFASNLAPTFSVHKSPHIISRRINLTA